MGRGRWAWHLPQAAVLLALRQCWIGTWRQQATPPRQPSQRAHRGRAAALKSLPSGDLGSDTALFSRDADARSSSQRLLRRDARWLTTTCHSRGHDGHASGLRVKSTEYSGSARAHPRREGEGQEAAEAGGRAGQREAKTLWMRGRRDGVGGLPGPGDKWPQPGLAAAP
jgi:hypothetical protein